MPAAPRKTATRAASTRKKTAAAAAPPRSRAKASVSPSQWTGGSPFPPIGEYAFLSDCHTGALVAPDGSVEWLCLPRFDSPSIFAALLDRSAGAFRIAPYGVDVPAGRRYEPGTNVLETTWMTLTGWLVVRDALTIGPWHRGERGGEHVRPPTDHEADHQQDRRATHRVTVHFSLPIFAEYAPVGRIELRSDGAR